MTMHSHSNGRHLPQPQSPPRDSRSFEFCLAGPYSAAAAETHRLRAPPPPPAAKTKSASSGYPRLPPRGSRLFEFEFCRAGPSSPAAAAAAETLPLRTPPPPPAAKTKSVSSGYQRLPPQRRPPRLGWSALAFGSVRVPTEMEMQDIRKRQRQRQHRWNSAEEAAVPPPLPPPAPECGGVGRGPWKLIRSLSCRGFESAAVVAAAAPLSLI